MAEADGVLSRIRQSLTLQERLSILESLVEWWHGPIAIDQGIPAAELQGTQLPLPLRWWYGRFGKRLDIVRIQNRMLGPQNLWLDADDDDEEDQDQGPRLVFYRENQDVYVWSTEPTGDDPPVWVRPFDGGEPWEIEEAPLSGFLIQMVLFEAIMQAQYGASSAWLDTQDFESFITRLTPLPLGSWRWPAYLHHFYTMNGMLIFAGPIRMWEGKQKWEVWIGAKTEEAMSVLAFSKTGDWAKKRDRR